MRIFASSLLFVPLGSMVFVRTRCDQQGVTRSTQWRCIYIFGVRVVQWQLDVD